MKRGFLDLQICREEPSAENFRYFLSKKRRNQRKDWRIQRGQIGPGKFILKQ
jgi:hypothetical protein